MGPPGPVEIFKAIGHSHTHTKAGGQASKQASGEIKKETFFSSALKSFRKINSFKVLPKGEREKLEN